MPWNDQSGDGQNSNGPGRGPWGGDPRKPWGQQPPRQPQRPDGPNLEDWLRRLRERFGGGGGGDGAPSGRGPLSWRLIFAVLFAGWLMTGIYFVNEGEQAVIIRLGRFDRVAGPGAHWQLPPPFEARMKYGVTTVRSDEIGCDRSAQCADPEEGLMLTGDRNIVDVHFQVQYNISNVVDFAFNVRDPIDTGRGDNPGAVRQVVESAMREVIGRRQLEPVITTDRASVEQEVQQLAQHVLDGYKAGVHVIQIQLLHVSVPPEVSAAFRDVISAGQDAETAVNNANRDSARIVNDAEAYRGQVIRQATGEAERFTAVYDQYRQAPQVTRDRIYIETMERVYQRGNLVILDQRSGAVPYLPLENMVRRPAPAQPEANR
jgi:membrane protease subunit HflK